MKLVFPAYYNKFRCIAGACPDTCCRDWELDIDDETYYRYQVVPGKLGEKIRSLIREEGGYRYFPLREDGFCPFYDDDGLCSLIRKLGYDALCQACDEYPRYFGCCGDYEQRDLSLSCPEAGRLFFAELGIPKICSVTLPEEEEEETEPLTKEEIERRDAVLAEQDRVLSALREAEGEDAERALDHAGILFSCTPQEVAALCRQQEKMNDRWEAQLLAIREAAAHYDDWDAAFRRDVPEEKNWFLRLACYFVFRYWIDAYFEGDSENAPDFGFCPGGHGLDSPSLLPAGRALGREHRPVQTRIIRCDNLPGSRTGSGYRHNSRFPRQNVAEGSETSVLGASWNLTGGILF